jgi:hypothetical protein
LVDGTVEITQYYIAFKPTIATEYIGFLQWSEYRDVRRLRRSMFRPPAIQITRSNESHSLILCVEDIDEWMSAISAAHDSYKQSALIVQNDDKTSDD